MGDVEEGGDEREGPLGGVSRGWSGSGWLSGGDEPSRGDVPCVRRIAQNKATSCAVL